MAVGPREDAGLYPAKVLAHRTGLVGVSVGVFSREGAGRKGLAAATATGADGADEKDTPRRSWGLRPQSKTFDPAKMLGDTLRRC